MPRPLFPLIEQMVKCDPGVAAECKIIFQPNDPVFTGHFPGDPLVPGVILTEALAHAAAIAVASAAPENSPAYFSLLAIRQIKFLQPVRPGDQILLRATKSGVLNNTVQFRVEAIVGGKQVAAGEIVLGAREMRKSE